MDANFDVNFTLKLDKMNELLNALANLPYMHVSELMSNIRDQVLPQIEAAKAVLDAQESANAVTDVVPKEPESV
jgi:hypothetical protein